MKAYQCILVVGESLSGKSTFAKYLAEYLGAITTDCSAWLLEVENRRRTVLREQGIEIYPLEKQRDRPYLIALGNAVCDRDPSFLIRQAMQNGAEVIAGSRRKEEVQAAIDEGVVKAVVLIESHRAQSKNSNFTVDSSQITDRVVNDGTLMELRAEAERIARAVASRGFNSAIVACSHGGELRGSCLD